jgi:hypothetical protein
MIREFHSLGLILIRALPKFRRPKWLEKITVKVAIATKHQNFRIV